MSHRIAPPVDTGSVHASVTVLVVLVGVGLLVGSTVAGAVPVDAGASENVTAGVSPGDVEIGEENQSLDLKFGTVEPGGAVDVYVNVTSLETVGVDLEDADVDVAEIHSANLTDVAVVDEGGTVTVRLSVEFHDDVDRAFAEARLTGLDTGEAEHATDLHHYVAVSDDRRVGENAPDESDRQSVSYDVVEPESSDGDGDGSGDDGPHTGVSPRDVEIGADGQTVSVRVAEATRDFVLEMDLSPLTEAGVSVDEAAVEVEETDRLNVTDASVVDGTVELDVAADAETGLIRFAVVGLDTGGATPTEELQYPLSVDGEPADPHESHTFDVFDPEERDDRTTRDGTVTPTLTPVSTDDPAGGDDAGGAGGETDEDSDTPETETTAGGTTADSATGATGDGFGPVVVVVALVAGVLGAVVRESLAKGRR